MGWEVSPLGPWGRQDDQRYMMDSLRSMSTVWTTNSFDTAGTSVIVDMEHPPSQRVSTSARQIPEQARNEMFAGSSIAEERRTDAGSVPTVSFAPAVVSQATTKLSTVQENPSSPASGTTSTAQSAKAAETVKPKLLIVETDHTDEITKQSCKQINERPEGGVKSRQAKESADKQSKTTDRTLLSRGQRESRIQKEVCFRSGEGVRESPCDGSVLTMEEENGPSSPISDGSVLTMADENGPSSPTSAKKGERKHGNGVSSVEKSRIIAEAILAHRARGASQQTKESSGSARKVAVSEGSESQTTSKAINVITDVSAPIVESKTSRRANRNESAQSKDRSRASTGSSQPNTCDVSSPSTSSARKAEVKARLRMLLNSSKQTKIEGESPRKKKQDSLFERIKDNSVPNTLTSQQMEESLFEKNQGSPVESALAAKVGEPQHSPRQELHQISPQAWQRHKVQGYQNITSQWSESHHDNESQWSESHQDNESQFTTVQELERGTVQMQQWRRVGGYKEREHVGDEQDASVTASVTTAEAMEFASAAISMVAASDNPQDRSILESRPSLQTLTSVAEDVEACPVKSDSVSHGEDEEDNQYNQKKLKSGAPPLRLRVFGISSRIRSRRGDTPKSMPPRRRCKFVTKFFRKPKQVSSPSSSCSTTEAPMRESPTKEALPKRGGSPKLFVSDTAPRNLFNRRPTARRVPSDTIVAVATSSDDDTIEAVAVFSASDTITTGVAPRPTAPLSPIAEESHAGAKEFGVSPCMNAHRAASKLLKDFCWLCTPENGFYPKDEYYSGRKHMESW